MVCFLSYSFLQELLINNLFNAGDMRKEACTHVNLQQVLQLGWDPAARKWTLAWAWNQWGNGSQRGWEMQQEGSSRHVAAFCMGPDLLAVLLLKAVLILQSQPAALFRAVNLSPLLEGLCHKLVTSSAEVTSILLAVDGGECWFVCPGKHLWTHRLDHEVESWSQVVQKSLGLACLPLLAGTGEQPVLFLL